MLIKPGVLSRIERKVGPKEDEGLFEIYSPGGLIPDGAGFVKGSHQLRETVAGRIMYLSDMNLHEKIRNYVIRSDADFMVTLKVGTLVSNEDILREIALKWQPDKYYFTGNKAISTDNDGYIYLCFSPGRSGDEEPEWVKEEQALTSDGEATWKCLGIQREFEVVELASPSTFGDYISTKAMLRRRQL